MRQSFIHLCLIFCSLLLSHSASDAQDKYALVIGIETYDTSTFKNLDFAGDDAIELAASLTKLGFQTTAMTSDATSSRLRPSSPEKILRILRAISASASEGDTLLVSFSGHGVQFADDPMLANGVRETYLCPSDADLAVKESLLKSSELIQQIDSTAATRKLLLVDACRDDVLSSNGQRKAPRRIEIGNVHESQRSVPGGLAVLFSCSSRQFSWEHDTLGHSVFSNFVINYLSSKAESRFYDRGKIDLDGLVSYVRKRTNDYVIGNGLSSDGQLPVLRGSSANWMLGEFSDSTLQQKLLAIERQLTRVQNSREAARMVLELRRQGHATARLELLDLLVLLQTHQRDQASLLLGRLRRDYPDSVERQHAEFRMGMLDVGEGSRSRGSLEPHLAKLIQREPFSDLTMVALEIACQGEAGGSPKRLRDHVERCLAADPNNSSALLTKGNYLQGEDYELALTWLTKACQADPNHAVAFNFRGHCNIQLERYNDAIADLDQVIQLNPGYINAYMQKARCLVRKGQMQEASSVIQKGLAADEPTESDYCHAAGLFIQMGRDEQGVQAYKRAIELFPKRIQPYRELAQYRANRGQFDEIKDVLNQAQRDVGDKAAVNDFQQQVQLQFGEFASVLSKLKQGTSRSQSGNIQSGLVASMSGDANLAIKHFELAGDPDSRYAINRIRDAVARSSFPRWRVTNRASIAGANLYVYSGGKQQAIKPGESQVLPIGFRIAASQEGENEANDVLPVLVFFTGKKSPLGGDRWAWTFDDVEDSSISFDYLKDADGTRSWSMVE